jgi:transposase
MDAEPLAKRQQRGIRLIGPTMPDSRWQAKAGKGFDLAHFSLDWEKHCPPGQMSTRFRQAKERMDIVCAPEVCAACPVRRDGTHSHAPGRVLHLRPHAAHRALQAQRQVEHTPAFRHQDALRSGLDSTISQTVRGMGIRRSRSDGRTRTPIPYVLSAVAINLVHMDAVLTSTPRGTTRRSRFAM